MLWVDGGLRYNRSIYVKQERIELKKVTRSLWIILMVLALTACGKNTGAQRDEKLAESDLLTHEYTYKNEYDRIALEQLVILIQAIQDKDASTIKSMFSKKAQKEIKDLDTKIDKLIETFPEWQANYEPDFSGYGKNAKRSEITRWTKPTFDFDEDGKRFRLHFCYYYEADGDPDMLGMYLIQIKERDYAYGDGFHMQTDGESSAPDIYMWDYNAPLSEQKPLMTSSPFRVYEMYDEEKMEYLNTMTEEEVRLIIRDDGDKERFRQKKMYTHKINLYYVALKELRFAYDYFAEKYPDVEVVYESVEVNRFDTSLLNVKGPDMVVVHTVDEPKKQHFLNLDVDNDEVTVVGDVLLGGSVK